MTHALEDLIDLDTYPLNQFAPTPCSTNPTRHLRGAFATNSIEINSKLVFGKERVDCA